ncbi:hypothetical protein C8R43DRAFT_1198823 [Mycena crocata]|nr:hypothetical protein C8R43DRAFT_953906 [Mycena crocata]KAJ7144829.1 hypothetical protein C8R43DRAFT_1198823 [Mycena crocata]
MHLLYIPGASFPPSATLNLNICCARDAHNPSGALTPLMETISGDLLRWDYGGYLWLNSAVGGARFETEAFRVQKLISRWEILRAVPMHRVPSLAVGTLVILARCHRPHATRRDLVTIVDLNATSAPALRYPLNTSTTLASLPHYPSLSVLHRILSSSSSPLIRRRRPQRPPQSQHFNYRHMTQSYHPHPFPTSLSSNSVQYRPLALPAVHLKHFDLRYFNMAPRSYFKPVPLTFLKDDFGRMRGLRVAFKSGRSYISSPRHSDSDYCLTTMNSVNVIVWFGLKDGYWKDGMGLWLAYNSVIPYLFRPPWLLTRNAEPMRAETQISFRFQVTGTLPVATQPILTSKLKVGITYSPSTPGPGPKRRSYALQKSGLGQVPRRVQFGHPHSNTSRFQPQARPLQSYSTRRRSNCNLNQIASSPAYAYNSLQLKKELDSLKVPTRSRYRLVQELNSSKQFKSGKLQDLRSSLVYFKIPVDFRSVLLAHLKTSALLSTLDFKINRLESFQELKEYIHPNYYEYIQMRYTTCYLLSESRSIEADTNNLSQTLQNGILHPEPNRKRKLHIAKGSSLLRPLESAVKSALLGVKSMARSAAILVPPQVSQNAPTHRRASPSSADSYRDSFVDACESCFSPIRTRLTASFAGSTCLCALRRCAEVLGRDKRGCEQRLVPGLVRWAGVSLRIAAVRRGIWSRRARMRAVSSANGGGSLLSAHGRGLERALVFRRTWNRVSAIPGLTVKGPADAAAHDARDANSRTGGVCGSDGGGQRRMQGGRTERTDVESSSGSRSVVSGAVMRAGQWAR